MFKCSARRCACACECVYFREKVESIGKFLFDDVTIIISIRPFCDTFQGDSIGYILCMLAMCACVRDYSAGPSII